MKQRWDQTESFPFNAGKESRGEAEDRGRGLGSGLSRAARPFQDAGHPDLNYLRLQAAIPGK